MQKLEKTSKSSDNETTKASCSHNLLFLRCLSFSLFLLFSRSHIVYGLSPYPSMHSFHSFRLCVRRRLPVYRVFFDLFSIDLFSIDLFSISLFSIDLFSIDQFSFDRQSICLSMSLFSLHLSISSVLRHPRPHRSPQWPLPGIRRSCMLRPGTEAAETASYCGPQPQPHSERNRRQASDSHSRLAQWIVSGFRCASFASFRPDEIRDAWSFVLCHQQSN